MFNAEGAHAIRPGPHLRFVRAPKTDVIQTNALMVKPIVRCLPDMLREAQHEPVGPPQAFACPRRPLAFNDGRTAEKCLVPGCTARRVDDREGEVV